MKKATKSYMRGTPVSENNTRTFIDGKMRGKETPNGVL